MREQLHEAKQTPVKTSFLQNVILIPWIRSNQELNNDLLNDTMQLLLLLQVFSGNPKVSGALSFAAGLKRCGNIFLVSFSHHRNDRTDEALKKQPVVNVVCVSAVNLPF